MSNISVKVKKVLQGKPAKLTPAEEREALQEFVAMIEEPAAKYEPAYKAWRKMRSKVRSGKIEETSEEYINAKAATTEARMPLHDVLTPLLILVQNISEENKDEAMRLMGELKRKPHIVQALVSVKGWNKIKKVIA